MDNKNSNTEKPIKLETLLKLKRFEHPDENFWKNFDKTLHQKTLQTLIERASLRTRFKRRLSIIVNSAYALPSAAMLILALYISPAFFSTQTISTTPHQSIEIADNNNITTEAIPTDTMFAVEDVPLSLDSNSYLIELPTNEILANNSNVEYIASALMPYSPEGIHQASILY